MKHLFLKLTLLCALLCGAMQEAWSMEGIVKREKEESLRFKDIKNGCTLQLMMIFGDVTLVTWEKNEILMECKTIVEAPNAELAEKGLKRHEFIHRKENDVYHISRRLVGKEEELHNVNIICKCTLYIPKNKLSLQLRNKFGMVNLQDSYKCDRADISVRHGSLHINELLTNEVGKLDVKFGKLSVEKANALQIETAHCGKVKLGTLKELTYKAEHCGDIHITEAGRLDLDVEHSTAEMEQFYQGSIRIRFTTLFVQSAREFLTINQCAHSTLICDSLAKGLKTECEHSKLKATLTDAKAFENFSVKGRHSTMKLRIPKTLNAQYDLSAHFGDIDLDTGRAQGTAQEGNHKNGFTTLRKGRIGKDANAKPLISIHGEHSNISVTE